MLYPVIQVELFSKLSQLVPEMYEFKLYFQVLHISNCYGTCVEDELDKTEQYLPNVVSAGGSEYQFSIPKFVFIS